MMSMEYVDEVHFARTARRAQQQIFLAQFQFEVSLVEGLRVLEMLSTSSPDHLQETRDLSIISEVLDIGFR